MIYDSCDKQTKYYITFSKFAFSYYTIIGPSYIYSDSTYSVAVSSDAATSKSVSLTIANDKDFTTSKSVTIQPKSSQVVDFTVSFLILKYLFLLKLKSISLRQIGSIVDGAYKFTAVGDGFTNETTITYQLKKLSIFIQSDKAMYKPGDKVQFRVIVVDRNLNPAQNDNMEIYVTVSTHENLKITIYFDC